MVVLTRQAWGTRYSFGAHLPIAGRKAEGSWATKGAENYPEAINVLVANLVMASLARGKKGKGVRRFSPQILVFAQMLVYQ